jgi:diguanylate cyclase (GGDEF)-like protein
VASLPLRARGEVWAVMDLYRSAPGTFSVEELRAARAVANLAASYLVLAADGDRARRAQEQLAHRATHDELTGLPNRTLLLDRLEHCLATARRHGSAVAVLFIDLDRFKDVNDTHGHAVGDYLLVQVARRLTSVRRAEDTLSRLGGDEFVLVCADLPDSDREAAAAVDAVSRRVRACLADAIPTRCGHIRVTASIGVALARPARDPGRSDPGGLLDAADTQMYAAKRRTGDAGLALAGPAG